MKNKLFMRLLLVLLVYIQACSPAIQTTNLNEGVSSQGEIARPANEGGSQANLPENAPSEAIVLPENEIIEAQNPIVLLLDDFYSWYFVQPGDEIFNQRTYENHPLLSDIFKSDVGYLLDSFEDDSGYDPFTCAQNFLPSITFDPVFMSGNEAYAMGQVVIDGETRHYLVVQLGQGEGTWKIDAIHCPFEPMTAAIAFYTDNVGWDAFFIPPK